MENAEGRAGGGGRTDCGVLCGWAARGASEARPRPEACSARPRAGAPGRVGSRPGWVGCGSRCGVPDDGAEASLASMSSGCVAEAPTRKPSM
jgi:hypothetical protein